MSFLCVHFMRNFRNIHTNSKLKKQTQKKPLPRCYFLTITICSRRQLGAVVAAKNYPQLIDSLDVLCILPGHMKFVISKSIIPSQNASNFNQLTTNKNTHLTSVKLSYVLWKQCVRNCLLHYSKSNNCFKNGMK